MKKHWRYLNKKKYTQLDAIVMITYLFIAQTVGVISAFLFGSLYIFLKQENWTKKKVGFFFWVAAWSILFSIFYLKQQ